ncbi:Uncharacterized protein ycf21 [Coccomyxa sp. Obi]|nr:Uncharacterized protein ycf21 [Coccomyxa sp. Obi]
MLAQHKDGSSSAKTGWHPLSDPVLWKVLEENAMFKTPLPEQLSPTWKLMLLSDGSVTRHLQLLTGQHIKVDCLEMQDIGEDLAGLPDDADQIPGPRVQRQVFLRMPPVAGESGKGKALVYAASWWSADRVNEYLRDKQLPIWASLSNARTELYRDVQLVCYGSSPFLAREFGESGPFWGRQYIFWHDDKPLTLIYEVFSTSLQRLLGPSINGLSIDSALHRPP